MDESLTDEQLRALLQSRDPAVSLVPATHESVARLMEDAMSHDVETPTHDPSHPETDPRRRTPLTWLLAAAAVLVIVGVGVFALFGGEDQPIATPTPDNVPASVLHLSAPGSVQDRCAMVTPELLSLQETAFDGTVTSVDGNQVTLEVGHWYRGGNEDLVTVEASDAELRMLIQAVSFEQGQRYLVSATDGIVTVCGFSAPYSDELAALYAEAFAA